MADQPLLSQLCSICHINTPKYRCPGCSTQTCSLQCVQRHKEWAQCSGKRDPTAYVKKSRLATPAGIDHDFNFISGIERSREDAEKNLENRGISQGHESVTNSNGYRSRLATTQVKVEKAPAGMSRQRVNQTKFTKSRRLMWTVEWVHEDQTTSIGQSFDTHPLTTEYTPFFNRLHGLSTKKRKRGAVKESARPGEDMNDNPTDLAPKAGGSSEVTSIPLTKEAEETANAESTAMAGTPADDHHAETKREDEDEEDAKVELSPGTADRNGNFYYLLKPHTSGSNKVLIPLSPTDCLLNCLKSQTVLEFPTIHVLSVAPEMLPPGFVLEADYLARFKAEQDEMQRLVAEAGEIDTGPDPVKGSSGSQSIPNAHDILAILERDIGGH